MKKVPTIVASLACVSALLAATSAQATFHLWDIVEAYSNDDGSVQFIEMFDLSNFENLVGGHQLTSNSHTFVVPNNLSTTSTANHRLLFATAGFGSLDGGVTPDFTIPANFFDPAGDTLNFSNVDIHTFTNAPTDGLMSIIFPGNTAATNSPTNFAGDSGSVDLSVAGLLGDYNGNDIIDAADYTAWRDALTAGSTTLANDPTPGVVDESDFTYWRDHFGQSLGAGAGAASAAVPEPTTAMLVLTGCWALLIVTRKRPNQP